MIDFGYKNLFEDLFSGMSQSEMLDDLYKRADIVSYTTKIQELKNKGYKIFRNKDGKHKVRYRYDA